MNTFAKSPAPKDQMAIQKTDLPLVSVLMPAYNHERFVEQAVRSVWEQTYKNVELIVIDDGSCDRTLECLERLRASSPIKMVVYAQSNGGICRALNKGLELANGDWIALLASDDYYASSFLEGNVSAAERLKGNFCIHSKYIFVDAYGAPFGYESSFRMVPAEGEADHVFWEMVARRATVNSATLFIRRALLEILDGFDEQLRAEDFDLHLRLARICNFHYIDRGLYFKRDSPDSLGKRIDVWLYDNIKALAKHRDLDPERIDKAIAMRHFRLIERLAQTKLHRAFELVRTNLSVNAPLQSLRAIQALALGLSIRIYLHTFGRGAVSRFLDAIRRIVTKLCA